MGAAVPKKGIEPRTALLRELSGGLISSLRAEVARVAAMPSAKNKRSLQRRLEGLAGRAERMEIAALHEELRTCLQLVADVDVDGTVDDRLKRELDETLVRIVMFAEGELARAQGRPMTKRRMRRRKRARHGTLSLGMVVGETVVESLLAEDWAAEDDAPGLAVERIGASSTAHHELRALKPDVIIVDGDDDGARRLVEQLMSHDETDCIPMIVLGSWESAEGAAAFIALGVSRTLPKPVAPAALREACLESAPAPRGRFAPLGRVTLDELGARLSGELHRGLCEAADDAMRRRELDLDDGAEVLTVLWEAIGRMRELVTAKSYGRVRFADDPVLDAMPKAAWIRGSSRRKESSRASRHQEVREPGDDVATQPLSGLRVVIAEDDLSTNWFLSGVLRDAGASVESVYDGKKALDHVYRELPDLIVSDVVMPSLDGYTLCRAVKRDVLLRSVPVVLLSWKQDLLQRMRELGANADGYMLKEAAAEEILQQVLEIMRPRRAVAERVSEEGTVRGRLDGLTPHAMLKIVADRRPDCRVSIRDSHHLYEIELRGGRPVLATRTNPDGETMRGRAVISALVGVGAGRFGIQPIDRGSALAAELDGSLEEQLLEPIARARAAQGLLSGPSLMRIGRVQLDEGRLREQLAATPEPSRGLLRALIAGASPKELVADGRAGSELVERVLGDAARHGAVRATLNPRGLDMLPAAVDREIAVLSGEADEEAVRTSYAMLTGAFVAPELGADDPPPTAEPEALRESEPVEVAEESWDDEEGSWEGFHDEAYDEDDTFEEEERHATYAEEAPERDLADMVFGSDLDDEDDEELPAEEDVAAEEDEDDDDVIAGPLARVSRPMIHRKGETPVLASALEVAEHARHHTPILSRVEESRPRFAALEEPSPAPPAPVEEPAEASEKAPKAKAKESAEFREESGQLQPTEGPKVPRMPMPSAWAAKGPAEPPKKSRSWAVPLVFGVIGVSLAIGARWYREQQPYTMPPAPTVTTPAPLPEMPPAPTPPAGGDRVTDEAPPEDDMAPTPDPAVELPLTKNEIAKLEDGQGLLEVVAGRGNQVFVGGKKVGRGPIVKMPLEARPDPYEVRVKMKGEERVRYVVVKEGLRMRLRVAPPWSR